MRNCVSEHVRSSSVVANDASTRSARMVPIFGSGTIDIRKFAFLLLFFLLVLTCHI